MKFIISFILLLLMTSMTYADDGSNQSNWVFSNIYPPKETIDEYFDLDTIKKYFYNRPIQLKGNQMLVGDYCNIEIDESVFQKLTTFEDTDHNFARSVFESINSNTPNYLNYYGFSAIFPSTNDCDYMTKGRFHNLYFDDEHLVIFLRLSTNVGGGDFNIIPIVYKKSVAFKPKPLPEDDVVITDWFPLVCASHLLELEDSECKSLELTYSVVKTVNYDTSDGYLAVTHINKKDDDNYTFNKDVILITEENFDRGPRHILKFNVSDNIDGDYWFEEGKLVAKFTNSESKARIKFATDVEKFFINNMFFYMKKFPHEEFEVDLFTQKNAICYRNFIYYEDSYEPKNNIHKYYDPICINELGEEVEFIFEPDSYIESDEYQG